MAKGVPINCDDYEVTVGGQTLNPRKGETITIRPTLSLVLEQQRDEFYLWVADFKRDDGNLDEIYSRMKVLLDEIVLEWTWTDIKGDVMPIPSDDSTIVERELGHEDIYWILALYNKVAVDEEEKKDGA